MMRRTARILAASLLLPACLPPAQAQATLLPEGSRDVSVAAVFGSVPSRPGGAGRSAYLLPQFSVQWDNGVFLDGLALGMQMSSDPLLRYGPVMALDLGAKRGDAGGGNHGLRPVPGGFLDYQPLRELGLHAHALAPAGGGALLNLKAQTGMSPAPRHTLGAAIGVNFASAACLETDFGTPRYHPGGGLRDVHADLRWSWQAGRKYTFSAALHASRLVGGAGASPRTVERTGIAPSLTVRYEY